MMDEAFNDVLSAELQLYGDFSGQLSVHAGLLGEDHPNDLAQAWIDGDHERVKKFCETRASKLRARAGQPAQKTAIQRLREKGWTVQAIAKALKVTERTVVVASSGVAYPRPKRKLWPQRVARVRELHRNGVPARAIAMELGLSLKTVYRTIR